jgi:predicted AlkP superfamily pyrophosphatase or phosphodiesterase
VKRGDTCVLARSLCRRALAPAAASALVLSLTPLVASSEAGHSPSPTLTRGLFSQGLLPSSTGLDAPRGDSAPTATAEARTSLADGGGGGGDPLRVYVVVVDGLRPQEVGPLTPTLSRLKQNGTWYKQARAVFPGETLPNHAAMMTGVLPQQNGIVANQIFRHGGAPGKEYLQQPEWLEADTLTTRLERAHAGAVSTATVLSKEYLYGLFMGEYEGPGDPLPQRQADFHWDPRTATGYTPSPSSHAVDPATMDAFLGWVATEPPLPQFAFVNLGDVDRAGHADESGPMFAGEADERFPEQLTAADMSPFRQAAIESTDAQIGRLVSEIERMGAWDETVLIVLSDHGMDWGFQDRFARTTSRLGEAGYVQRHYTVVGGGGSELFYVNHDADIAPMARILSDAPGVEFVATEKQVPDLKNPTLGDLGIDHPLSPQIEAFLKPGWHSSPFSPDANPLPGNHGHSVTQHSALLVGGGHPLLRDDPVSVDGETVFDRSRERLFVDPAGGPGVLSIAPTVAALFGIGEPAGGYDVAPLAEAFDADAAGESGLAAGETESEGEGAGSAGSASGLLTTTLTANRRRVGYRKRFSLSGRITAPPGCGGPLRVTLHKGPAAQPSSARAVASSIPARADGAWSQRVSSPTSAAYFASVQPTRNCQGSLSTPVTVPVRARVRVAPRCGSPAMVNGRLAPRAPRTRVLLQRRQRGGYRRVASGRLDRASRFHFRLPSCAGRYRVVWPSQGGRNVRGMATFTAKRGKR